MFSLKILLQKTFDEQKFRPQSITSFPMQLNFKQMNPTNASVETGVPIQETQWPLWNAKSVSQKLKNFCFSLDKNWPKKLTKTQNAAQLNGVPSIRAKTFAIANLLKREDSKIMSFSFENSENWVSFANNLPKIPAAKNSDYGRCLTRRNFYTKIRYVRSQDVEKPRFKEMKRRRLSQTGKKRSHFDVSLFE